MIYFARSIKGGPIKIGCSGSVKRRMGELRVYYDQRFIVLKTEPGETEDEKAMHLRFADLRIGETEFFQPGPALMDYLGLPPFIGDYREVQSLSIGNQAKNKKIEMRVTPEWLAWLGRFAKANGVDKAVIAREAIVRMAKEDGFKPPPEE